MRTTITLALAALLAALTGCAARQTSAELEAARALVHQAEAGTANDLEPEHVLAAKQHLARAEYEHEEEAGSMLERHYAYLAQRKAAFAMAAADYTLARHEAEASEAELMALSESTRKAALDALEDTRTSLDMARGALSAVRAELAAQAGEASEALRDKERQLAEKVALLEQAQEARKKAETDLAAALASLEKIASVRAEEQRLIITLSGAVLFGFAKTELMPIAKERLKTVAEYLKQVDDDKKFRVVGHTDNIGSDSTNMALSKGRAEAVRKYLIDQGVDEASIEAIGMGESQPVVSNDSPENRANNRRVEIIIE